MAKSSIYIDLVKLRTVMAVRDIRSYTELSELSGVTKNTISAICNGKSCAMTTAKKIADVLKINVFELMLV